MLLYISLACMSTHQALPGLSLNQPMLLDPLERHDYEVLGAVEGQACAQRVLLIPIPDGAPTASMGGVLSRVQEKALASAIAQQPLADAVISPVWTTERFRVLPFYSRTCVTVRARAIHIVGE